MATDTFYPDADPESNSADGRAGHNYSEGSGQNWATIRAASGNTANDNAVTAILIRLRSDTGSNNWSDLDRGIFGFDTSTMGASPNVSSATFSVYGHSKTDGPGRSPNINVYSAAPASDTAIVGGDFDSLGTTDFSTAITYSGFSTSGYNDFVLNSSGEAHIDGIGTTFFGVRNKAWDADGATAPWVSGEEFSQIIAHAAEASGTSQDPKLVVVWTGPPQAPTNLSAVCPSNGSTDIDLSWTDNSSGGNQETGFEIERSDDGSSGWTLINTNDPDDTTYTDSLGTNSTQKYYRVRATNADGDSAYTSVASATTAPAAPSGLAVAAADDSNVLTITWTDNSSDETSFSLERSNDGVGGWSEVATPAANATSATDDVGARDTQRYYRITAKRSGDSIDSNASGTANGSSAPADPSGIGTVLITGGIRVTWTDNSSTETTFKIERKQVDTDTNFADLTTDTASPYDDTAVSNEEKYVYRLRAFRSTDSIHSGYTGESSKIVAPPVPTNLQALPTGDVTGNITVDLIWDKMATKETGFLIERSLNDSDWSTVTTTSAGASTYQDSGLTVDTTYYYRISAVGVDGNSPVTSSVSVITIVNTKAGLTKPFLKKVNVFPRE